MSDDPFRKAQDEYFKLRGQLDAKKLSREDFEASLHQLRVQDAQGRYWMPGAETGDWYVYDGTKWVPGKPPEGGAAGVVAATAAPPPTSAKSSGGNSGKILATLLAAIIALALLIGGYLFASSQGLLPGQKNTSSGAITPILPLTTPTRAGTRAAVQPSVQATANVVVPTVTAAQTELVVATLLPTVAATESGGPTAATTIPTLEPVQTAAPTPTVATPIPVTVARPTSQPTASIPTITRQPTATPTSAPTNTPEPNFPPNVYVTNIVTNPSAPLRNQPIGFTATFLNTTGETRGFNWLIQIYDPNKAGGNKRFGESNILGINVPPGTNEFSVTYPGVKGPGGCISLYAQAEWVNDEGFRTPFSNTDGSVKQLNFDVCPTPP